MPGAEQLRRVLRALAGGLQMRSGHLDALAARQPVGLDDEGAELLAVLLDALPVSEHAILGVAGDVVPTQELARERLARLELRQRACGADTGDAELALKRVDNPHGQRPFGTDEDEVRPVLSRGGENFFEEISARFPSGGETGGFALHAGTLAERRHQGARPTVLADDCGLHRFALLLRREDESASREARSTPVH